MNSLEVEQAVLAPEKEEETLAEKVLAIKNDFSTLNIENAENKNPEVFEVLANIKENKAIYQHFLEMESEGENSHFRDAIEIAQTVENIWSHKLGNVLMSTLNTASEDELRALDKDLSFNNEPGGDSNKIPSREALEKKIKENMIYSALVHDIGKNGPAIESDENKLASARKLTRLMYRPRKQEFKKDAPKEATDVRKMRIGDYIKNHFKDLKQELGVNDLAEIEMIFSKDLEYSKEDLANKPMLDFWRNHTEWGAEILAAAGTNKFITTVAPSHHAHESAINNPSGLFEPDDEPDDQNEKKYNGRYNIISKHNELLKNPAEYALMEKANMALTVLDVYQAYLDRGRMDHKGALGRIEKDFWDASNIEDEGTTEEYIEMLSILPEK